MKRRGSREEHLTFYLNIPYHSLSFRAGAAPDCCLPRREIHTRQNFWAPRISGAPQILFGWALQGEAIPEEQG